MAGINVGQGPVQSVYVGQNPVQSVYVGSTKVWPTAAEVVMHYGVKAWYGWMWYLGNANEPQVTWSTDPAFSASSPYGNGYASLYFGKSYAAKAYLVGAGKTGLIAFRKSQTYSIGTQTAPFYKLITTQSDTGAYGYPSSGKMFVEVAEGDSPVEEFLRVSSAGVVTWSTDGMASSWVVNKTATGKYTVIAPYNIQPMAFATALASGILANASAHGTEAVPNQFEVLTYAGSNVLTDVGFSLGVVRA